MMEERLNMQHPHEPPSMSTQAASSYSNDYVRFLFIFNVEHKYICTDALMRDVTKPVSCRWTLVAQ